VLRPLSQAYGAVPATAASTVLGAVPYLAFAGTLSAPRLAQLAHRCGASSPSSPRQHGSRDAALEPGRPCRREHPRQPAAVPRAGRQRARRGRPTRRARDPGHGRRRRADPGRRERRQHHPARSRGLAPGQTRARARVFHGRDRPPRARAWRPELIRYPRASSSAPTSNSTRAPGSVPRPDRWGGR
jgi:hypothetical protein